MFERMTNGLQQIGRTIFYALVPLVILLSAISISCILGFIVVKTVGDFVPFQKIVSKSTQLLLILSIFPTMKLLNIDKQELGFATRSVFFKQLAQGFLLGILTLLPVIVALYGLKINVFEVAKQQEMTTLISKIAWSLPLALLVSLIEEPLFRGILITGLARKIPTLLAIIISAVYYASLHFLDNNVELSADQIHFWTGFSLLKGAFLNVFHPYMQSSLLSLIVVGIFLGLIRTQIKTSLAICIGCHACWVWQIKISKTLFDVNIFADYIYLVGSYDGVVGPLVTVWLLMEIIKYVLYRQMLYVKTE